MLAVGGMWSFSGALTFPLFFGILNVAQMLSEREMRLRRLLNIGRGLCLAVRVGSEEGQQAFFAG